MFVYGTKYYACSFANRSLIVTGLIIFVIMYYYNKLYALLAFFERRLPFDPHSGWCDVQGRRSRIEDFHSIVFQVRSILGMAGTEIFVVLACIVMSYLLGGS